MIKCVEECRQNDTPCENRTCRKWIDYEEDLNCCLVTIEDNKKDGLTLHETAKRIGLSFVRVRQIEKQAIAKLAKLTELF
jgi:hypothetical protein